MAALPKYFQFFLEANQSSNKETTNSSGVKGCTEQQDEGLPVSHGSCLQAARGSEL